MDVIGGATFHCRAAVTATRADLMSFTGVCCPKRPACSMVRPR